MAHLRNRTHHRFSDAAVTNVVEIAAAASGGGTTPQTRPSTPQPNSVAVLPFVNNSPDADQEHFVDGLTGELINSLNRIRGLAVTGRTSSFAFKGKNESLHTIREALGVEYVLEAQGDRRKDPTAVPGWGAAHDAEMRFRRLVYDAPIGKVRLDKLRTAKLKEWRNAIQGSKSSQNRNWEALRAALYLAVADRRVNPALREELRSVKKHKNAKKRRELYLDLTQRRAPAIRAPSALCA